MCGSGFGVTISLEFPADVVSHYLELQHTDAPRLRLARRIAEKRSPRYDGRPMSAAFERTQIGGPALHKNFRDGESCYGRNVAGVRRQRASAAASSALARGQCSTSEIPASANASALTSMEDAAASSTGCFGAIS